MIYPANSGAFRLNCVAWKSIKVKYKVLYQEIFLIGRGVDKLVTFSCSCRSSKQQLQPIFSMYFLAYRIEDTYGVQTSACYCL